MNHTTTQPAPADPGNTSGGDALSTEALVGLTLDSYRVSKSRSRFLQLEREFLAELGAMIVNEKLTDNDGLRFVEKERPEFAPTGTAYSNFAHDFRRRFDRIRQAKRAEIVGRTLALAAGDKPEGMVQLLQGQILRLMTEKIVDTRELAHLEGRELGAILAAIEGWNRHKLRTAELAIKEQDAERRAAKLAADLSESELQRQILQRRIDDMAARFDAAVKEQEGGGAVSVDLSRVKQALFGVAPGVTAVA